MWFCMNFYTVSVSIKSPSVTYSSSWVSGFQFLTQDQVFKTTFCVYCLMYLFVFCAVISTICSPEDTRSFPKHYRHLFFMSTSERYYFLKIIVRNIAINIVCGPGLIYFFSFRITVTKMSVILLSISVFTFGTIRRKTFITFFSYYQKICITNTCLDWNKPCW